jgi:hypothetical protein
MTKCTYEGCRATSEAPATDGWRQLVDWPGIADGWYCRPHADALEAVIQQDDEDADDL